MLKNDQKFGKKIENITYGSFCVLQVSTAIIRLISFLQKIGLPDPLLRQLFANKHTTRQMYLLFDEIPATKT